METDTNFVCTICLEKESYTRKYDYNYVKINCGHVFCIDCLKEWISSSVNISCPICRSEIFALLKKRDLKKYTKTLLTNYGSREELVNFLNKKNDKIPTFIKVMDFCFDFFLEKY